MVKYLSTPFIMPLLLLLPNYTETALLQLLCLSIIAVAEKREGDFDLAHACEKN